VAGNVVSARKRALSQAQADALVQALISMDVGVKLSEEGQPQIEPRLRSTILGRPTAYMRTYRVLEEVQADDLFKLKLRGRCDLSALRRAVQGGQRRGPIEGRRAAAADVLSSLQVTLELERGVPFSAADLRSRLQSLLAAPSSPLSRVILLPGGAVVEREAALKGRLKVGPVSEIRGLARPSVRASLQLFPDNRPTELIAWGEGESVQAAAVQACREVFAQARPSLERRRESLAADARRSATRGHLELALRGVKSMGQALRLCEAIKDRRRDVVACAIDRLEQGWTVLRVEGQITATDLSTVLSKVLSGRFEVQLEQVNEAGVWASVSERQEP